MAYLSVPKIFRHLTFLHLSSPFIVDNCSHISNLSFAITYCKKYKHFQIRYKQEFSYKRDLERSVLEYADKLFRGYFSDFKLNETAR